MTAPFDNTFTDSNSGFTGYGYPYPSQNAAPRASTSNLFASHLTPQQISYYRYTPQQTAHMNRQGLQPAQYPKPQPQSKTGNTSPSEGLKILSRGTSQSLMGGMNKIWESGEYSDLTIQCGDQEFLVHKVVVGSQSKVLAAAMKKGFKESELSIIDLSDDGVLLVSNLMKFLYTGNYPSMLDTDYVKDPSAINEDNKENSHPSRDDPPYRVAGYSRRPQDGHAGPSCIVSLPLCEPLHLKQEDAEPTPLPDYTLHVEMYALSDQYDIPALAVLARAKLEATCLQNWNSPSFLEIIPRVYETTLESNKGLRSVVLEYARKHANDFMKNDLLKASFQSVLAATPEFGTALLNEYMMLNHSVTSSTVEVGKAGVCADCGEEKDGWHDCQSVSLGVPEGASAWFP